MTMGRYSRGRAWSAIGQGLAGIGQGIRERERQAVLDAEREGDRAFARKQYEDAQAKAELDWRLRWLTTPGVRQVTETTPRTLLPDPGEGPMMELPDLPDSLVGPSGPSAMERAGSSLLPDAPSMPSSLRDPVVVNEPALREGEVMLPVPGMTVAYDPLHQERRMRTAMEGLDHIPEPSREAMIAGVPASVAIPTPDKPNQFTYMGRNFNTPHEVAAARAIIDPPSEPREDPKLVQTRREAQGSADMWAMGGNDAAGIESAIARFYPGLPYGERAGIAARAVQNAEAASLRAENTQSLIERRDAPKQNPVMELVARIHADQVASGRSGADRPGAFVAPATPTRSGPSKPALERVGELKRAGVSMEDARAIMIREGYRF